MVCHLLGRPALQRAGLRFGSASAGRSAGPSGSPSSLPSDASSLEMLLMWWFDLPYHVVTKQPDTPPAASADRGAPKSHHQNAAAVSSNPNPGGGCFPPGCGLSLLQLSRLQHPQAWLKSQKTGCIGKGLGPVSCPLPRALLGCVRCQPSEKNRHLLVLIETSRADGWT